MDSSSDEAGRFIPITAVDVSDGRDPSLWHPHCTTLPRDDEGVSWIRGRYNADSPQGKALLVAYVLAEPDYGYVEFAADTTTVALRGKRFLLDKNGLLRGNFPGCSSIDTFVERPSAH